jgi:two-component system, chemotaxis family, protein-glutamate methylesterase/glutaminase
MTKKRKRGHPHQNGRLGRDLVVVGTSAGGIEALRVLIGSLPRDFPAAVMVVLHLSPHSPSLLSKILARTSQLTIVDPRDGERLRSGTVYLAQPNLHLMVENGKARLVHGPRENRHRPSVDTLFRSAAANFKGRVIGVLLTGNLNDGTAGLWAIKRADGTAIVQDPADAQYPGMPSSAVSEVKVDHVVPLNQIAPLLQKVLHTKPKKRMPKKEHERMKKETNIEAMHAPLDETLSLGQPSAFTCPECNGSLWTVDEESLLRYRCRTGHSFTAESLDSGISEEVERALWSALRALGEKATLMKTLAQKTRARDQVFTGSEFQRKAREIEQAAKVLQRLLTQPKP